MNELYQYVYTLGPLELVGVAGFVCYVLAFGAVQCGRLDGNSLSYTLANILAASLVAISLLAEFNLASALIQSSWILLGVLGLALRVFRSWPATREVLEVTLEQDGAC